ncbi:MAG TPA: hypothetical protein VK727_14670 [Steroidobacteraceae bacterium]|jgi:hypothetical protein|nr:hypothetical protein [Steroidobacteraceae bacterium]
MRQVNSFFMLASAATLVACATSPAPGSGKPAPAGYYTKVVEGQQLFCRNDLKLGSRVEREGEKCYTADQLKEKQDADQAAVNGSLSTQHGNASVQ